MYVFKGICAPASHLRLKSLKHALPNVYLEIFLGSVGSVGAVICLLLVIVG